ncbi:MAG: hypothetical protein JO316_06440 [Abitibacteriaceae bacterium]|nr:hypothetical protein [Abditibacteriaceae bacterium]
MDCRQIESLLAKLSADDLPASKASAIWEHLTKCPECEQEWRLFQTTLTLLSSGPQPLITVEQSQVIWRNCSEKIHDKIEKERLAAQQPAFFSWMRSQPRWGWAALGGAMLVLGGVWWLTPQDAQETLNDQLNSHMAQVFPGQPNDLPAAAPLASLGQPSPGPLITFQRPPANASAMVNNHTIMAFDPFVDHVGTAIVSHEAAMQGSRPQSIHVAAPVPVNRAAVAPLQDSSMSNAAVAPDAANASDSTAIAPTALAPTANTNANNAVTPAPVSGVPLNSAAPLDLPGDTVPASSAPATDSRAGQQP